MKLILTECPSGKAIRVDNQVIYYAGLKDGIVSFTTDPKKAINCKKDNAPIVAGHIMESLDITWSRLRDQK